jgi:hypothetical protein
VAVARAWRFGVVVAGLLPGPAKMVERRMHEGKKRKKESDGQADPGATTHYVDRRNHRKSAYRPGAAWSTGIIFFITIWRSWLIQGTRNGNGLELVANGRKKVPGLHSYTFFKYCN